MVSSQLKRPLNVLSVAYPLLAVGADSGGGAEQVLFHLDRQLVASGHRSIVIAARGSRIAGELVTTPAASGVIDDKIRQSAQAEHQRAIEDTLRRHPIDLVHFHGLDFHAYRPPSSPVPQIVTLHLPVSWYPPEIFAEPHPQYICVSKTQAFSNPLSEALPVISNGVDLDRFRPGSSRREDLLWLGRICPEKGADIALRVAHKLDLPLTLAGPVHPFASHQLYFEEQVRPLLDGKRVYVGPVGLEQKTALLAESRCLLVPSLAAETSSLVAMEALSSGTPVVGFRSGALPEVVEDDRTGYIVDTEEKMADAVSHSHRISAEACRRTAKERFDAHRMVAEYLELYLESAMQNRASRAGS